MSDLIGPNDRRITYFKRYRMEIELREIPRPRLPSGYVWTSWESGLVEAHALTLYESFHGQIDSQVFPNLRTQAGCKFLMTEISRRSGFLPSATWLVAGEGRLCGSIQGIREWNGMGAIQNLGVPPDHQGRGLGTALLCKALEGFALAGLRRVLLEVTADNVGAVRLYRRLGFCRRRTLYRAVEVNHEPIPVW